MPIVRGRPTYGSPCDRDRKRRGRLAAQPMLAGRRERRRAERSARRLEETRRDAFGFDAFGILRGHETRDHGRALYRKVRSLLLEVDVNGAGEIWSRWINAL